MKIRSSRRTYIFLLFLLLISFIFVGSSWWIINDVNKDREKENHLIEQVAFLAEFEAKVMNCINQITQGPVAFNVSLNSVSEQDFELATNPEFAELDKKASNLGYYHIDSVELTKYHPLIEELEELNVAVSTVLLERQQALILLSEELGHYWDYSHILIVSACFLSFLLVLIGIFVMRSKRTMSDLKDRNMLFMKSVSDCVIIADNKGKIQDYNKTFSNIFGYNSTEAIGMHISDLYTQEADWKRVAEGMDREGSFVGEIINKRKNGEDFISFLSANAVYNDHGVQTGTMGISRDITEKKRNEEQVQHIINNATDIIYTTNLNGEITYVNNSAIDALGYSQFQFEKMSFRDIIHPDYIDEVEEFYRNQIKDNTAKTYLECKIIKSDGEEIWVGQNVRASFDPIDPTRVNGFFGIIRNLNEVKRVELDLQESESKYRELFDNSKDLIQSVDANGNFLYVNNSWKNAMGYSDKELVNINFLDVIHEDSRDMAEELFTRILKFGEFEDKDEYLFKMKTKTGEEVVLEGTISMRYEGGQVKSIQTFFRDVTEHLSVELALKKSEENFRLIGNSINDVFFLYDITTSTYDFISPKCEDVLGAKADFFINGGNYSTVHVFEDDQAELDRMNEAVRNGENGHIEYRRITEDGELRWVDEKWFPIKDKAGKVVSISGICRDITDIKSAYNTILNQNTEINQSILYAKNIQESTLPTREEINEILPNSFVYYRAKDVLSGDLYIIEEVIHHNGDKWPAFIVGDCTGHGVPGGLLSLLCNGLLTESLTSLRINSPAEALGFVREKLIRLFRSNPSKYILDGMDAAFCVLNYKEMELYYAGANIPCYIVRNGEVIEYRGDKQPVGYSRKMEPYVHVVIKLEQGDQVYLTTDGYVDQFGGAKGKKFLRKRFTDLLVEITDLSMSEQRTRIKETFLEWKGEKDQTDDVAIIGVKI